MGYNARNDEIRDNVTRMRREWEAQRGALATVRRFNAILSAKGYSWFWPKIAAALTSEHPHPRLCPDRSRPRRAKKARRVAPRKLDAQASSVSPRRSFTNDGYIQAGFVA